MSYQNRNNLEFSNSPYLKQHADNPVHWNEWKSEVLEIAKKENKPIIVSIGYSTCHWCHVMAHESFEDADTAELMNQKFISIKIDREERPDLDMFFMNACQLITGKGGWPLNVFCLPDGRPFHAGTYFQKEHWKQLLNQLSDAYINRYDEVISVAENLTLGIEKMDIVNELSQGSPEFTRQEIAIILDKFENDFDQVEGGLSRVPKFPLPVVYHFLLNYYKNSGNKEVLNLINLTLIKMGSGGIYDHVRGGFARYSTDRFWKVPHFEKMLYDNAQLIALYSKAYAATQIPVYKSITEKSILFLESELTSENGLFQSALDADTDGVEGKYYVYTWDELRTTLGEELDTFSKIYNCTENGNWEHGLNILYISKSPAELVSELQMPLVLLEELKKRSFDKLKVLQKSRTRPGLDYKVVASWNALMVKGLCVAYDCFKKEDYLLKAVNCANQFSENIHQVGFLPRIINIKNSDVIPGFLDDYAYWTDAFLALYHSTFKEKWLFEAQKLMDMAIYKFGDEKSRLLWYSEVGNSEIASRSRDLTDDVTPSSNSVMALNMQKIGYLFGDTNLINRSFEMFSLVNKQFSNHPAWYSNWGNIALSQGYGFVQLCCTGLNAVENANQLKPLLSDNALLLTDVTGNSEIPLIKGKFKESRSLIYVCYNQTCFEPVENIEDALVILEDCGYDLAH